MNLAKLLVALGLDASEYNKGLEGAAGDAEKHGSNIGSMLGNAIKAGLAIGAVGIAAAIGGIISGVASNAQFERYEVQFGVLLGSAEQAQQRLEELAQFGARTPFELPQVVEADKILQGFGLHSLEAAERFGFSGEQIRTIAGDVASGTGVAFQDMALLIGKFSAGATGEAISRMAELGIASRSELAELGLEFDKSGALLTPLPEAMEVVLQLMNDKFGGMMEAQSGTFEGMISNLMDWKDQTLRTISAPIFEVLKDRLGALLAFLGDPNTQAAITEFATAVSNGIGTTFEFITNVAIPNLMNAWAAIQPALNTVISFVTANATPIFAGLAAVLIMVVVPAFIAWSTAAFTAATATIAALAPVVIPIVAIGAAVALLVAAWTNDWGGIRTILTGVWEGTLQPIFNQVVSWLQQNIPAAIQAVSEFFTGTFIPALRNVWNFIDVNILPIFRVLVDVHMAAIGLAVRMLAALWENILMPALHSVWSFIQANLLPIFQTWIADGIDAVKTASSALAAFFTENVQPVLVTLADLILRSITPAWQGFQTAIDNAKSSIDFIAGAVSGALEWLRNLADTLNSIEVPGWLQGHSPPPMAHWFDAIGESAARATEVVEKFGQGLDKVAETTDKLAQSTSGADPLGLPGTTGDPSDKFGMADSGVDTATTGVSDRFGLNDAVPGDRFGQTGVSQVIYQIAANYAFQDEKTVREDIRMQGMLGNWGQEL